MDVFNKLKSTVSHTVSQFSGVLPGNPVTREYEVISLTCSAGPGLMWKVYQGFKKSTKQEASVFVFEKKLIDKWPREEKEVILELLKYGVTQLTKLRHPQILTVQHPLEESRESLAFATEPVFSSLSNTLKNYDYAASSSSAYKKDFKLFDIEIKYGLLQIAQGLAFLHEDVKLLHQNISPESIIINQQGAWKIFGFDFCLHGECKQDGKIYWLCTDESKPFHYTIQPSLDYMAPERGCPKSYISTSIDMFSLGMIIYALYNNGKPLFTYNNDWDFFIKKVSKSTDVVSKGGFDNIPSGLRETVKMLLHKTPELRPDAHQFAKVEFFEDIGVKTLNYLDSLFQWNKLQKSQFYKDLPPIIQNFPQRVCLFRVIPCLGKEFTNSCMVPFVLPAVLQIAETCTQQEYMSYIFHYLQTAMKMTDPVQILLIFMQRMELLLKLTPANEIKTDVLPMLYRALESDVQQIQEICLSVLPNFPGLIDYSAMKNAVLPRIKRMCVRTTYLSVRVNSLVCIGKLLDNLDKWMVLDEILPFLQEIPSREPPVLMGILGIYKITLTHKKLGIPKDVIATRLVPFLMPLTIENGLTVNQLNTLFGVLKDMINRVESEQKLKIEQLTAISQKTSALTPARPSKEDTFNEGNEKLKSDLESVFSMETTSEIQLPQTGNLFFKDIQRITKQQEALQKPIEQPDLMTTGVDIDSAKRKNKDPTEALLESNLNEMKLSSNLTSQGVLSNNQCFPKNLALPTLDKSQCVWKQPTLNSFSIPCTGVSHSAEAYTKCKNILMQPNCSQNSTNNFNNLSLLAPVVNVSSTAQKPTKLLTQSEINDLLS